MRALLSLLLAVLLLPASPAHAQKAAGDETAALFREAYGFITEYALRPPDPQELLARAVSAVQAYGPDPVRTSPPSLTGDQSADLDAVASYVASVARSLAPARAESAVAAALRAMVRGLDDAQAEVFTPAEFAGYLEGLRGEHAGIGAQVQTSGGRIVLADVTGGGPAARAGLAPGDVLVEVNGLPIHGRTPDEVLEALRGQPGTSVGVTVRRGSAARRVILTREVVRENPTRSAVLDTGVGYLRLLAFTEGAARDAASALAALRRQGAGALVLDLRRNTGGLVDESVDVASFFLTDGNVAMEERRDGLLPLPVRPGTPFAGPVVVLVDTLTASAGEIVAGALQDTGASLVGTNTYGKATVQSVSVPGLPGGWGIRVTTARYYTRSGRNIEGTGLQPDVIIPMRADLIQSSRDRQLQRALIQLRLRLGARAGGR